jgi:hypothetical protein
VAGSLVRLHCEQTARNRVAGPWLQVPSYRMYNKAGKLQKEFTTGDVKKLKTALYLFLS